MILFVLSALLSCGSAVVSPPTELPSITSGGDTLDSGSTTALSSVPSNLALSFPSALDPDTFTTDNVTLTCEDQESLSISEDEDTDGIANNEYTITPEDGFPQLSSCSLEFSTEIQTANLSLEDPIQAQLVKKNASLFNEEVAFAFTTPCDLSGRFREDFNWQNITSTDDLCLSFFNFEGGNVAMTIGEGIVTFDVASILDTDTTTLVMAQSVSEDFTEARLKIVDFSGLESPGTGGSDDPNGFKLSASSVENTDFGVECKLIKYTSDDIAVQFKVRDVDNNQLASSTLIIGTGNKMGDITAESSMYLRLGTDPETGGRSCEYRFGDTGSFIPVSSYAGTIDYPDDLYITVQFLNYPGNATILSLDYLMVD